MNQEINNFFEALVKIQSSGEFLNQYAYDLDEN